MFILFFTIVVGSMMGNEITKTHNLPQNGDNFTKTRISFVAPGDSGKKIRLALKNLIERPIPVGMEIILNTQKE